MPTDMQADASVKTQSLQKESASGKATTCLTMAVVKEDALVSQDLCRIRHRIRVAALHCSQGL